MAKLALAGKKIAVLIDNLFIPDEIAAYKKYFGSLGATVELVTRRWGQQQRFYFGDAISDLEPTKDPARQKKDFPKVTFDQNGIPIRTDFDSETVTLDFDDVDANGYAAVLMAANYSSVRLRFSEDGEPRNAPAVRFFARAMSNPAVVKGALCHGLWILTPMPELLKDREVICNPVVVADIRNAGAIIKKDPSKVWIDDDLVTGESKHEATEVRTPEGLPSFIQAIVDQILKRTGGAAAPSWKPMDAVAVKPKARRRILMVVSERGYWGEELVGPLDVFDDNGYETVFVTPNGKRPGALPPSMDPDYIDPPLGRSVTSPQVAAKVIEMDNTGIARAERSKRLDNPVSLAATMPERPYWSVPNYLRRMEAYYRAREKAWNEFVAKFDALIIVGGSGPIVDLVNNQRVHDLIIGFYTLDKPVAAECYGVPCLAFAREVDARRSLIWGKHVTGHCIEYDYKDGTGFLGTDLNIGPPPYPLEYILRDATGERAGSGGGYHGNVGHETSVMVDYPFITGRSTPDSYLTGEKLVEVLDKGLRKFGWGPAEYAS
jgi:putative intracellular protease/amidase